MAGIAVIEVADPPELWRDLGFAVEDGACRVGGTTIRLGAPGEGVTGWGLDGVAGLAELPLAAPAAARHPAAAVHPAAAAHPNGVVQLDHVVVATPDLDRTVDAFEQAGVELRRLRDIGTSQRPAAQAFFKLGGVVVEVVGSPGRPAPGPARFYGLAFTVTDLDATGRLLGDRLRPAKPAVQPGRHIATVDRAAGSTVPLAFMSPPLARS